MKKIYILLSIFFLSVNAVCQVSWTKNPDPVLTVGSEGSWDQNFVGMPCVLFVNDTSRMWYSGSNGATPAIGYATSTDGGITWTKYEQNPVLNVGPAGSWEEKGVYYSTVLFHESTYHMWYQGFNINIVEKSGYATSPDGVHWTKYQNNPINLGAGGVLFRDNLFQMWYSYYTGEIFKIGKGTSENGINWSEYEGNPVMNPGPAGSWDRPRVQAPSVIYDGQKFHLWYSGGDFYSWQLGYASSLDGISWTRYEGNPVLPKGSAGSWDDKFTFYPSVIFDDANSLFKMWYYGGQEMFGGEIGYAEAPLITGINSIPSDIKFSIYPNPVDGPLTVEMESQGKNIIEITTLNGQVILSKEMEGTTHQIDLSSFRKGVYFITIRSEEFVTTRKIIKL